MMGYHFFATGLFLFFLGSAVASSSFAAEKEGIAAQFIAAPSRPKVPSVVLQDERGKEVLLKEILKELPKGNALLVSFWARFCAPCVQELPALASFAAAKGRISVILVGEEESKAPVLRSFLTRRGIENLPLYGDSTGDASRLLGIRGLPAAVLLDSEGGEIGRISGPVDWAKPETRSFFETKL